jgi:transglutaminase-like putative cysteine protease
MGVLHWFMGWGDVGTEHDLAHMASLIDASLDDERVIGFARAFAVTAGVRNQRAQAYAIRDWLQRVWRFVEDPARRELLRDPAHMLLEYAHDSMIRGDCDEAAILGAALGNAVGIPAQLVALAFADPDMPGRDRFQHVYAVLLTPDGEAVSLDVTKPPGPVPVATRTMTIDV